jgi:uncharacterized protein YndB with AHSA1/START domain
MTQATAELDHSREIVISRTFNAPRHLVWDAWTDPKHVAQWWGPKGFATQVDELDLRVGGTFLLHMRGPDGDLYPCKGIYREIIKPERLVYLGIAEDAHACGGGLPPRATVTVSFAEKNLKTTLTIHTRLETAADREAAISHGFNTGWAGSLDSLGTHLDAMA